MVKNQSLTVHKAVQHCGWLNSGLSTHQLFELLHGFGFSSVSWDDEEARHES
jgi:hypothetical protein